jgi:hypothetical protein
MTIFRVGALSIPLGAFRKHGFEQACYVHCRRGTSCLDLVEQFALRDIMLIASYVYIQNIHFHISSFAYTGLPRIGRVLGLRARTPLRRFTVGMSRRPYACALTCTWRSLCEKQADCLMNE